MKSIATYDIPNSWSVIKSSARLGSIKFKLLGRSVGSNECHEFSGRKTLGRKVGNECGSTVCTVGKLVNWIGSRPVFAANKCLDSWAKWADKSSNS